MKYSGCTIFLWKTGRPQTLRVKAHVLSCPLAHGISRMLFLHVLLQALFLGCPINILDPLI